MAISKVVYGDDTLIDLTSDTVSADSVLDGVTFHSSDGESGTGTVVTAPLDDTTTTTSNVWSASKTNTKIYNSTEHWSINVLGGGVQEITIDSGDLGEREITFSWIFGNCGYRLFANTPNGKMVTIKSSEYTLVETTSDGVTVGTMKYTVNVPELPTTFRLREFKL